MMRFLQPRTLAEAYEMKAADPSAVPVAGGTDVMVELNFDRQRPEVLLDVTRLHELNGWSRDDEMVRVGAGVTYARIIDELGSELPGLAMASRTVGSPQIRNRGTVGGNLGSASPAGDAHPPLLASGAEVEVGSVRGVRRIPVFDFFTGVKRHVVEPDELITAFWTTSAEGPQQFAKIGVRNAMVIALCSFALALHPASRTVGTGLGSVAPTPVRAVDAEKFVTGALDWDSRAPLDDSVPRRFGELVAAAARSIDDVRGSAAYRTHAVAVLARRTLARAWDEYRRSP